MGYFTLLKHAFWWDPESPWRFFNIFLQILTTNSDFNNKFVNTYVNYVKTYVITM